MRAVRINPTTCGLVGARPVRQRTRMASCSPVSIVQRWFGRDIDGQKFCATNSSSTASNGPPSGSDTLATKDGASAVRNRKRFAAKKRAQPRVQSPNAKTLNRAAGWRTLFGHFVFFLSVSLPARHVKSLICVLMPRNKRKKKTGGGKPEEPVTRLRRLPQTLLQDVVYAKAKQAAITVHAAPLVGVCHLQKRNAQVGGKSFPSCRCLRVCLSVCCAVRCLCAVLVCVLAYCARQILRFSQRTNATSTYVSSKQQDDDDNDNSSTARATRRTGKKPDYTQGLSASDLARADRRRGERFSPLHLWRRWRGGEAKSSATTCWSTPLSKPRTPPRTSCPQAACPLAMAIGRSSQAS